MKAMKALLKKEWTYSLDRMLMNLLIISIVTLTLTIVSIIWDDWVSSLFVAVFGVLVVFYVPVTIWGSLKQEWNETGSFWLNQNVPGVLLIVAKLLIVLFQLLLSVLLISIVAGFIYFIERGKIMFVGASNVFDVITHYIGYLTVISIISCALGGVLLAAYFVSKSLPRFGSFIGTVLGIATYASLFWVTSSSIYSQLFEWGKLEVGSMVSSHSMNGVQYIEYAAQQQHIGEALFVLGLVCLSVWISSWLMDNKARLR